MDTSSFSNRELQKEAARALESMRKNGVNITKFNKRAHHDSQAWYRAVIEEYYIEHGGFPSTSGPGQYIKLISDV